MITYKDTCGVYRLLDLKDLPSVRAPLSKHFDFAICTYSDGGDLRSQYNSPVIVSKCKKEKLPEHGDDQFETEELDKKRSLFHPNKEMTLSLFPAGGSHENLLGSISRKNLSIIDGPGPFSGRAVTTERFDASNTDRILDYVSNYGSLFIKISELNGMLNFFEEGILSILKNFKHNTIAKFGTNKKMEPSSDCPTDELTLLVVFHSLRTAIPIFDPTAVDGLAMSVFMCWPQTSMLYMEPYYNYSLHLLMANHTENVFDIDGQELRQIEPFDNILSTTASNEILWETDRRGTIPRLVAKFESNERKRHEAARSLGAKWPNITVNMAIPKPKKANAKYPFPAESLEVPKLRGTIVDVSDWVTASTSPQPEMGIVDDAVEMVSETIDLSEIGTPKDDYTKIRLGGHETLDKAHKEALSRAARKVSKSSPVHIKSSSSTGRLTTTTSTFHYNGGH